ncbi:MAG: hypothetical protein AUJ92_16630 [Armatimonadetes bacterium CG2_30_59_28]|nr:DUF4838 domain-containing protein [Armatimonadota bacterium]OIO91398.1 MAG: hypothetical protein AUJ92_16630 [Armatimonadetes bacterium CG2_30_59_28]PIU60679.1 MAG: hypothetical protein COS85_23215 [Armatimonadetes bacterium CG07_land_8_20_14_0_80_59_28]PIY39100.1 MAG: hypothetical protein COZ05_19710 [Armatimonadetes bacterium CG_4_10_14_3_um_filter_59_10]PJB62526.1 MAG: hypothetical protein CO095_18330 [Armatimonadetes bacterium CG_4_9_14_3_um_filter_58_7]
MPKQASIEAGLFLSLCVALRVCNAEPITSDSQRVRSDSQRVRVDPANAVIMLPSPATPSQTDAARELSKHLKLITGADVATAADPNPPPGKYPFYVGSPPPGNVQPLAPEEARWVITPKATYLYGDGYPRRGEQFAVYAFLEDQLGVRWIRPGDSGIGCETRKVITLTPGEYQWRPQLEMRNYRPDARPGRGYPQVKDDVAEFSEFLRTREEHDQYANDVRQWQLRMRMGGHSDISYGHAFTDWWDKYSKTHPDYFALNRYGKREPELRKEPQTENPIFTADDRQSVKLCVSNPEVVHQIIESWIAGGKRSRWISVCENDNTWGYCRCDNCQKLDAREEGEAFGVHLTDRYVHLTNAVAREAAKHDPTAGAVMYAYNETELPPCREKLEPNVVVGVVPTTVELPKLRKLYEGWSAAGAKALLLRPNYPCYYNTISLPMGFEKQMFDAFQVAVEYGAVGVDYDSLMGMWPVTGMSDYVLAKAFSDPTKPFEHWEEHYCSAYGPAAEPVKQYFQYWREELWNKRLLPDIEKIVTKGKYYNFARGLMWSLGDYYKTDDFDRTDAILQKAAAKKLSPPQEAMLNQLMLANQNARLTFNAITTQGLDKFEHSRALLTFRKQHKDDLQLPWLGVFATETRFGDLTGTKTAERLKDYPLPWIQTTLAWQFKLDPEDVGLKERWQEKPWEEVQKWDHLRTDFFWDNPYDAETDPELMKKLRNYDGIGWYSSRLQIPKELKERDIFLYFGAVDESCWVYVNGKLAGEHVFKDSKDWCTPFEIRIDPLIDWERGFQHFTVRVEDRTGAGGIWRRVWLVSEEK